MRSSMTSAVCSPQKGGNFQQRERFPDHQAMKLPASLVAVQPDTSTVLPVSARQLSCLSQRIPSEAPRLRHAPRSVVQLRRVPSCSCKTPKRVTGWQQKLVGWRVPLHRTVARTPRHLGMWGFQILPRCQPQSALQCSWRNSGLVQGQPKMSLVATSRERKSVRLER
jgi:hypothetical protein